ncbi:MAG: hypothetical protein NT106_09735 [Candidatus Sumerlaeota bacterium]|nr:hypothetical protein [Candidatus Sumerlaeota bacterium]
MSALEPGENVLHSVPSVGFISSKALPTYRLFFPIPPLMKASLIITDRRVIIVSYLFGFVIQKFSSWYPERSPEGELEIIESVSLGKMRLIGPYLEVVSFNDNRPWYYRYLCAARVRLRFYMKNPEPLYETLSSQLTPPARKYY